MEDVNSESNSLTEIKSKHSKQLSNGIDVDSTQPKKEEERKSRFSILKKLKGEQMEESKETEEKSNKIEKGKIKETILEIKRKKQQLERNSVGNQENDYDKKEEDDDLDIRQRQRSLPKTNPQLANKLKQLFQNRIVQIEATQEEEEEEDDGGEGLDPEVKREKSEKLQIKKKLLKLAMEKKKDKERSERKLRKKKLLEEEEETNQEREEKKQDSNDDQNNNNIKTNQNPLRARGGVRSIIDQIKQKKNQKEELQRSFEQLPKKDDDVEDNKKKKSESEEDEEERRDRERYIEMIRKQEEKLKKEEKEKEEREAEERKKEELRKIEEQKKKEELQRLKEEIKKKEELKKQEEERIKLEKKKAEEEEKKLLEIKLEEERKIREKIKKEEEEKKQKEEEERKIIEKLKKEEEEKLRKEEFERQIREKIRKEEEERLRQIQLEKEEEERKQLEEEKRLREKFKKEEMERQIREKIKKEEEERKLQEKLRKEEEERLMKEKLRIEEEERMLEEQLRKEEEERLLKEKKKKEEEKRRKEEERKRKEEERKKKEEEERKRKEEEEKKRKEEEEKKRKEEEKKKKEEEERKRKEEEERKLKEKIKQEEEKKRRQEEERIRLERELQEQKRYQQAEEMKRQKFSQQQPLSYNQFYYTQPKFQNEQTFEPISLSTYQKPYQKKQNATLIYNPKKAGLRGRSIEKVPQINTNSNLNNTSIYSSYSEYSYSNLGVSMFQESTPIIKNTDTFNKSPSRYTKTQQFFKNNSPISAHSSRQINSFQYNDYFFEPPHQTLPTYSANNDSLSINLEDLMILEEKLNEIITAFLSNKIMTNECFEWWNYYFNCSLFHKIEKAFKDEKSREIVQMSINHELLSIMIAYDVSFDRQLLDEIFVMLKPILYSNHHNLIIICEYILSKISSESINNIWVLKLRNLVYSVKTSTNPDLNPNGQFSVVDNMNLSEINKINFNTNSISSSIRIILKNYPQNLKTNNLIDLYKRINKVTYEEINDFFQSNIMRVENPNASVLASVVLRENGSFSTVEPPYLKTSNLKQYTLVLDLDETIVHFKINPDLENEGVLKVRPGIHEFLETLGKVYEIIVFTAATKEYADILIDEVEENKIYFDYRLYRQHTVIIDNDFVKDLTRLGRPLDKIIIVDNMPQNFRLQKENGINIRAFWGEDKNDTALIELMPILLNIAKEGGDVRKGLAKYKDEIVKKVTMNMSKYNN